MVDWRILEQISPNFYILSHSYDTHVQYAPLYITRFALNAPRKQLEAQLFQNRWGTYGAIDNIPDRLRWLRHSRGLMQKEVARVAGVSRGVYADMETGKAKQMQAQAADRLAAFYGVPAADLLDDYSSFLRDGQTKRIRACREKTGLDVAAFAETYGIPIRSLRAWESGKKVISYHGWERYFAGRA